MKVLAIGNSFSSDATRYLHQIAAADGEDIMVVNLYIGGCSLETHYKNITDDVSAYVHQLNGQEEGRMVSVKEALLSEDWDVVTLQQVSNQSVDYSTYQPYLNELSKYVKQYAPKAKQMIHQTWAYEDGSEKLMEQMGYQASRQMFDDIKIAYEKATHALGDIPIIPSGLAFDLAVEQGLSHLHRDTFHASYGFGRYLLGLVWYQVLTGNPVTENTFQDFDEGISAQDIKLAKRIAETVVKEYRGHGVQ